MNCVLSQIKDLESISLVVCMFLLCMKILSEGCCGPRLPVWLLSLKYSGLIQMIQLALMYIFFLIPITEVKDVVLRSFDLR